ncbi:Hypothetical predicted protein [Pelobates cultripes]|uniref:Uncharacterized protein n=1 Tax=Pelobates cultripes TaxID=61616 RepID=A0AAD1WYH5_PELCU|nr:Hypothetical predicted protein [Pelobates cultripes]
METEMAAAAATCARDTKKPDLETRLDELFARFWRTIASREQQAKAYHPVTILPVIPQQTCTPPHANKALGRQHRKACKPKRLPLPMTATRPYKGPAKLNLPKRHEKAALLQRHTALNRDRTGPRQTTPQPLYRQHSEADPRPGIPRRRQHSLRHNTSRRFSHGGSTSPARTNAETPCIEQGGWIHHNTDKISATRLHALRSSCKASATAAD